MQLTKLRDLLLQQHAALRELIAQITAQSDHSTDPARDEELRKLIGKLTVALGKHNRFEESSLRGVIVHLDAWGPQRESLMDSRHHEEHQLSLEALEQSFALQPRPERAAALHRILEALLTHMKHEEREVLHPNVLRDDVITADPFGG